ncbi:glycoside hydrolase family 108 protein [Halorhodospira neutriphila]|uniref:Uncharacterized protein n=1 Tax=Halorhodospira neutriphila TaxID=168379 RepID=A0ABS1E381_9GAMM|nr:N-acetylmuramidase [Halorhodospira neutriphila]MBK1725689.1 hypothetical protein [Halorhodospira neutriphila]
MDTETIIDHIIEREGGFVHDPDDRGGATRYGVTRETLSEYRGEPASVEDVRQLTEAEARQIYRKWYVEGPGYDAVEDGALRALLVDSAVQHGPSRATRWLQRAAGAKADGVFGPQTAEAVSSRPADQLYAGVLRRRAEAYGQLITEDPSQARFAHGWMRRLGEFIGEEVA